MDWVAAEKQRRTDLRMHIRKTSSEVTAILDSFPELNVVPTRTLPARQESFNRDLQHVLDTLHRRHVNFAHVPRRGVGAGDSHGRRPRVKHPFCTGDQMKPRQQEATETPRAPASPTRVAAASSPTKTAAAASPLKSTTLGAPPARPLPKEPPRSAVDASTALNDSLQMTLATSFSPRRGEEVANQHGLRDARVARAWFGTAVPALADPVRSVSALAVLSGGAADRHDATKPTASALRRQGLTPEVPMRLGDGYLSGADRLALRKNYAEQHSGGRTAPRRAERRPIGLAPMSEPRPISELTAGVHVRAGDVSTFIRQHAVDMASGMQRPDVRSCFKARLGGTSKPRQ